MTPADLRALCERVLGLDAAARKGRWVERPHDGRLVDAGLCSIPEYRDACPALARALLEALEEIERHRTLAEAAIAELDSIQCGPMKPCEGPCERATEHLLAIRGPDKESTP